MVFRLLDCTPTRGNKKKPHRNGQIIRSRAPRDALIALGARPRIILKKLKRDKNQGRARVRTGVTGNYDMIKIQSDNHYTTQP